MQEQTFFGKGKIENARVNIPWKEKNEKKDSK